MTHRRVLDAAEKVLAATTRSPYAHTSHLLVRVDGTTVVDEHLRGPLVSDVFSVTKTVLATALGVMARRRLLPDLDSPLGDVLPVLRGQPHTWRHLLTMTRGAEVDDTDEVVALPGGQVERFARAAQLTEPGTTFAYDDGAAHLLSAAAGQVLGESLGDFARREVFEPVGITDAEWLADPDGVTYGHAHLRISADSLGRLGQLWLDRGESRRHGLIDPDYFSQLVTPSSAGGPPEQLPYGFLVWLDDGMLLAGGWAGQHVLVVPSARAVVVTTGFPNFRFGPPPADDLPPDWAPALDLVRRRLLPVLRTR
ncbi:beta-lactamase [Kribbella flavida DSM 17836]|uniref:Beta-lactamase n=1 Tax=Kribbella flavida (strain DSM 17836 / JCM 10339 / NBRC 14399) TaxID=479435 RepID=D2Q3L0_KRIFD|nr:serine hydrolase domain-containing protein [Kribbella flavida]ADB34133.1 beta-lactamase [Kribbella flavida DSM 17836]